MGKKVSSVRYLFQLVEGLVMASEPQGELWIEIIVSGHSMNEDMLVTESKNIFVIFLVFEG